MIDYIERRPEGKRFKEKDSHSDQYQGYSPSEVEKKLFAKDDRENFLLFHSSSKPSLSTNYLYFNYIIKLEKTQILLEHEGKLMSLLKKLTKGMIK